MALLLTLALPPSFDPSQVLFEAKEAPDDDLKVLVMECLLEVPIDNLQAPEVANIVSIVADCDNLTVGRTEEILSHAFAIMQNLPPAIQEAVGLIDEIPADRIQVPSPRPRVRGSRSPAPGCSSSPPLIWL